MKHETVVPIVKTIQMIAGYFHNMKEASRENETLCILLDTIQARLIDGLWKIADDKKDEHK